MATEYRYQFGQRWNRKTPRGDLHWYVGTLHVGETDAEVTVKIEALLPADNLEFTAAIRRECIRYALLCHQKNNELYNKVMRGI